MTLIEELKSAAKIGKFYITDIIFVFIFWMIMNVFQDKVSSYLQIIYNIFNIFVGIILVIPSKYNPKKRLWQSFRFMLTRDNNVYTAISVNERSEDFD